jgi:type IV fimbrial biogenesis protein FimT
MPRRALLQRRHARGFSLLELMVVLTLIAVLALLATPSMVEWMKNQRIRGSAEAVLNGLQTARAEAIRRNRPAGFWLVSNLTDSCALSNTSGTWVVSVHSPANACATAPSATTAPLLVTSHAAQGNQDVLAADASGSAASEVRFDGYGRILDGSTPIARIDIRDPADASKTTPDTHTYRSLRVLIHGTGAIRLCDPRISTTGDTRAC